MAHQAEFNEQAEIVWDEVDRPLTNMFHMQSAMFMDRADLWPMTRRPAHKPVKVSDEQAPLII